MKLNKLTQEQESLMHAVREESLSRFFSLHFDEEGVRNGSRWIYEFCELKDPIVIVVDSPLGCQIAANILHRAQVGAQVGDQVRAQVRAQVGAQVRAQVGDQVGTQVWAQVGDQVGAQVGTQVWAQVGAQVGDQKLKSFSFSHYGDCWSSGWVSRYDFFHRIGLVSSESFMRYKEYIYSGVFMSVQLDGACIISRPPILIRRRSNKLHCEDGPAIEFADGYKQWYWKGTSVPQHWIEGTIQDEELRTGNAELRRVLIDILGPQVYFERIGEKLEIIDVDVDHQGKVMRLLSFRFEGRTIQCLECRCPSTERVYHLYPPNQSSKTVWEAKGSTFEISEDECKQLNIET